MALILNYNTKDFDEMLKEIMVYKDKEYLKYNDNNIINKTSEKMELREDIVEKSLDKKEVLKNTKSEKRGFFETGFAE